MVELKEPFVMGILKEYLGALQQFMKKMFWHLWIQMCFPELLGAL